MLFKMHYSSKSLLGLLQNTLKYLYLSIKKSSILLLILNILFNNVTSLVLNHVSSFRFITFLTRSLAEWTYFNR